MIFRWNIEFSGFVEAGELLIPHTHDRHNEAGEFASAERVTPHHPAAIPHEQSGQIEYYYPALLSFGYERLYFGGLLTGPLRRGQWSSKQVQQI